MAGAYFSTILDVPVDRAWATVRDFSAYEWAGSRYCAVMEDGRAGDVVGAVRRIGNTEAMRQRLVQLSDADHSLTYDVLPGSPIGVANYRACLRLRPITDTGRTFIEWSATFDCAPEDAPRWERFYAEDRFPTWLHALRAHLAE